MGNTASSPMTYPISNNRLSKIGHALRCPVTGSSLRQDGDTLISGENRSYPVINGVPVLLAPREKSTLWVVEASRKAALSDPENKWHEDTIGVSPEELAELKSRLEKHQTHPEAIDPIISFLVAATSGHLYADLKGTMQTIPIPDFRFPPMRHGELLLDIGCNWGRWSIAAAKSGYHVIGMDPSLGAVLAAQRLARDLGLDNISFIVADALQLPFAPNTFDAIFSYSVLQHFSVENATTALQQAAAVSREDARLMIQMPNRFGVRCLYHLLKRGFRPPVEFDVRYYSPDMLVKLFSSHYGECELSVDGFFGLGIQASDKHLMSVPKKWIISTSELLRKISLLIKPLTLLADSLYVQAVRHQARPSATTSQPQITAY